MVDWAYVNGMGDDCGDPDHDIHDPDGHCGPGVGALMQYASGGLSDRHLVQGAYGPPMRCNRCGSRDVYWQIVKGNYVLFDKETLSGHLCPTNTDGFDDEPIL